MSTTYERSKESKKSRPTFAATGLSDRIFVLFILRNKFYNRPTRAPSAKPLTSKDLQKDTKTNRNDHLNDHMTPQFYFCFRFPKRKNFVMNVNQLSSVQCQSSPLKQVLLFLMIYEHKSDGNPSCFCKSFIITYTKVVTQNLLDLRSRSQSQIKLLCSSIQTISMDHYFTNQLFQRIFLNGSL